MRFGEYEHRVKNQTQLMLSILVSAKHATRNEEVRSALRSVTRKVEAIVRVQAILRRSNDARCIRADELIRAIAQGIREASPRRFVLIVEAEPHELPSSAAGPLGLIANELLTNAVKHGTELKGGRVRISLKSIGEQLELRVDDNGPGIAATSAPGSGLTMVTQLATQLHGRLSTLEGPGGHCIVRFIQPHLRIDVAGSRSKRRAAEPANRHSDASAGTNA